MMAPELAGAAFFPYQSFSRDTFPISPATIVIAAISFGRYSQCNSLRSWY
jgi:hypothetical protein